MTTTPGLLLGGRYELVRPIAGGVWAARHHTLGRQVAVKVMSETMPAARRRFELEAHVLADLGSRTPHVARVLDFGSDGEAHYIVMELLDGETLRDRIDRTGKLAAEEVSVIVTQVANALATAHVLGIVHRDVRPSNVFLTREHDAPFVKLIDFSIARPARRFLIMPRTQLTLRGMMLGDRAYASPEQAMGEKVDARADVWSLAVVAYEALAGVTPFKAPTDEEVVRRVCTFDATPLRQVLPDASEALEAIFARAFTRAPRQRFQSVSGFAGALAAAIPKPERADVLAAATDLDTPPALTVQAPPIEHRPRAGRDAPTVKVRLRRAFGKRGLIAACTAFVVMVGCLVVLRFFSLRAASVVKEPEEPAATQAPAAPPPPETATAETVTPIATPVAPAASTAMTRPPPPPRPRIPKDPSAVF